MTARPTFLVSAMRAVRSIGDMWSASWSSIGGFFGIGGYNATDPRRKILPTGLRPTQATANELLTASLPLLRAYCRQLERNHPVARGAIEGRIAEIVGTGIDLEPDTGDETTNARIRTVWRDYLNDCGIKGQDIFALQRQACFEENVAGEFVWRLVVLPERVDAGKIPVAILPLEAEWFDDTAQTSGQADAAGITWVGGVGVDTYGRPVAYRLRAPGYGTFGPIETFKASEIIHGFEGRRSLQARGEPRLASVIEVLQQMQNIVSSELKAAENCSAFAMVITAEAHDALDTTEDGTSDDPAQAIRLGTVARLHPGEKAEAFSHTRPSQQIAPFFQMLLGQVASGVGVSQKWLDRDYQRVGSYSSMRGESQDSHRLLDPERERIGHATIGRLYRAVLSYVALTAGVPKPRDTYRLLPCKVQYIEPVKDIQGKVASINAKFASREQVVAELGGDYRQISTQLAKESTEDALAEIARVQAIQKACNAANAATPGLNLQWAQIATLGGAATAPGAYLAAATTNQVAASTEADGGDPADETDPAEPARASQPPQVLNFDIRVENQPGKPATPAKRQFVIKHTADGATAAEV